MSGTNDDPIVGLSLHESTISTLVTLLRALQERAEQGAEGLSKDLSSYLMQALDSGADIDILFGVLADTLEDAHSRGAED